MVAGGWHTRKYERVPAGGEINFSLSRIELGHKKDIFSRAEIINSSEGGLCIKTQTPLEVGNILNFEYRGNKEQAMVKWVIREEGIYIAGIMFLKKK
ncbi:MAG: PilZ domain-containing protein [Thermodesulfovibrionales bacterium]|nr:PilZ domain-containing protein [Thermodesulfovibrionales bacterium]